MWSNEARRCDRMIATTLSEMASIPDLSLETQVQVWRALAAASIFRQDFGAAETWIRQACRCFGRQSSSQQQAARNQFSGDLLAMRGWMVCFTGNSAEAERSLTQAIDCHQQSDCGLSVCLDLVLRSRLNHESGYPGAAAEDLARASDVLRDVIDDPVSRQLAAVVRTDSERLSRPDKHRRRCEKSYWN